MDRKGRKVEKQERSAGRNLLALLFLVYLFGSGILCLVLSQTGNADAGLAILGVALVVCVVVLVGAATKSKWR